MLCNYSQCSLLPCADSLLKIDFLDCACLGFVLKIFRFFHNFFSYVATLVTKFRLSNCTLFFTIQFIFFSIVLTIDGGYDGSNIQLFCQNC